MPESDLLLSWRERIDEARERRELEDPIYLSMALDAWREADAERYAAVENYNDPPPDAIDVLRLEIEEYGGDEWPDDEPEEGQE